MENILYKKQRLYFEKSIILHKNYNKIKTITNPVLSAFCKQKKLIVFSNYFRFLEDNAFFRSVRRDL